VTAAKAIALLFANLSKSLPSLAISFLAAFEPLSENWVMIRAIIAPVAMLTPLLI
jgi:hypothetical protein